MLSAASSRIHARRVICDSRDLDSRGCIHVMLRRASEVDRWWASHTNGCVVEEVGDVPPPEAFRVERVSWQHLDGDRVKLSVAFSPAAPQNLELSSTAFVSGPSSELADYAVLIVDSSTDSGGRWRADADALSEPQRSVLMSVIPPVAS